MKGQKVKIVHIDKQGNVVEIPQRPEIILSASSGSNDSESDSSWSSKLDASGSFLDIGMTQEPDSAGTKVSADSEGLLSHLAKEPIEPESDSPP